MYSENEGLLVLEHTHPREITLRVLFDLAGKCAKKLPLLILAEITEKVSLPLTDFMKACFGTIPQDWDSISSLADLQLILQIQASNDTSVDILLTDLFGKELDSSSKEDLCTASS